VYQVTPLVSAVYTLVANTNSSIATCLTTKFATLTVFQNPTVTVTPGKQIICKGETHTLTATGASSYSWSGATSTGSVITVKPTTNTTYTIIGTDVNGCENTVLYTAKVSACIGIQENTEQASVSIYPNPTAGEFVVKTNSEMTLRIVNSIGQEVRQLVLTTSNGLTVRVSDLSDGVYFIIGENAEGQVNQKIIITK
jgi:hypothetical protein